MDFECVLQIKIHLYLINSAIFSLFYYLYLFAFIDIRLQV